MAVRPVTATICDTLKSHKSESVLADASLKRVCLSQATQPIPAPFQKRGSPRACVGAQSWVFILCLELCTVYCVLVASADP